MKTQFRFKEGKTLQYEFGSNWINMHLFTDINYIGRDLNSIRFNKGDLACFTAYNFFSEDIDIFIAIITMGCISNASKIQRESVKVIEKWEKGGDYYFKIELPTQSLKENKEGT